MRKASPENIPRLVALMAEFYREAHYPLNEQRAAVAFSSLVRDERLGQVWLIEADTEAGVTDVGYIVVTLGFSMEYGGRDAFIDDLFIQSAFRGRGLGTAALAQPRSYGLGQEVRAMRRACRDLPQRITIC